MTRSNDHDRRIAAMFDRIAHRYDLLNHALSFGQDLSWRGRAVALAGLGPAQRALDVGAGPRDRKSTRPNSSHLGRAYAVLLLKKKHTEPGHTDVRRQRTKSLR